MNTIKKLSLALLPLFCLTMVVSCKDNSNDPVGPSLTKDSAIKLGKQEISTSLAGGTYLIEYTIENPHEGEKISAEAAENWVNNFKYNISGALSFSVDANTSSSARECLVTVKYRYAEDVAFVVKQNAKINKGFTLENVTPDYFAYTIDIIPEDKRAPYIVMSAHPEYIIASGFETPEDFYEDDVAYFGWLGSFYGNSAVEIMQIRSKVGDQRGVEVDKGAPCTPYTAYCYYFDYDSGALLSDVALFEVKTAGPQLADIEFTMNYTVDSCLVSADVTPVGYDGDYYFDVLNVSLIESYLNDLVDLEGTPYFTTAEEVIEYWWANAVATMKTDLSLADILANYTCKGENSDGSPKSHFDFELLANAKYYLFAFKMDENALCASTPKFQIIETGDVVPSNNVITPSVSNITSRIATIKFETTNDDYYVAGWATADEWASYGNNDAERQEYFLTNFSYELLSGDEVTKVLDLEADTEYVVYAFGSRGGKPTTSEIFTCTFRTKSGDAGNVTIELRDLGYYDAGDIAEFPGYEQIFSPHVGEAVIPYEVVFSSEEHGDYFYSIYDWTGRYQSDYYNEEQYIDGLVWSIDTFGSLTATHSYAFLKFGGKYELVGIVLDTEGQYSDLYRRWVEPTYDGCGDAQDYVDWWDAYQESQSGGPELTSRTLFQKKSVNSAKASTMTFDHSRR